MAGESLGVLIYRWSLALVASIVLALGMRFTLFPAVTGTALAVRQKLQVPGNYSSQRQPAESVAAGQDPLAPAKPGRSWSIPRKNWATSPAYGCESGS